MTTLLERRIRLLESAVKPAGKPVEVVLMGHPGKEAETAKRAAFDADLLANIDRGAQVIVLVALEAEAVNTFGQTHGVAALSIEGETPNTGPTPRMARSTRMPV
jgi:hypothetical protein